MIYVSSSCIKSDSIEQSIRTLAAEGFKNIELSGGTVYREDILDILISLQKELGLNYLLHNYFPPPKEPFVLNLASLDDEVHQITMNHIKKAIDWSIKLGAEKFAFHAGFLLNIPLSQIGKKIERIELFDEVSSYRRFNESLIEIRNFAKDRIDLYIENNVLSTDNFKSFNLIDPFFFTSVKNMGKVEWSIDFNCLLDVAHLKVSCQALSLNFLEQLKELYKETDYIHISDNNGLEDSNQVLTEGSELYEQLKSIWVKNKTITIEVYSGMDDIKTTYNLLHKLNTN